jgi:cytochrome c oxidase subunit 3
MATDTVKEHVGPSEDGAWDGGKAPMKASYGKLMMWYFLLSDAFTFTGFLIAYGTLRFSSPTWPVPDFVFKTFPFVDASKELPLIFVTVMSFVLIISSGTMVRAVQEGHRENQKGVVFWMLMTVIGGAAFLGCQAWEWSNLIGTEKMTVTVNPFGTHTHSGAYLNDDGSINNDDTFELGASYLIHSVEHASHAHGGGHGDGGNVEDGHEEGHEAHDDEHHGDDHGDGHHGDDHADGHHGDDHAASADYSEGDHPSYVVKDGFVQRKYKIMDESGEFSDDTYSEAFGPKAFGALFFAITGFHGFHVFSGVLFLFIIMINAASGQYAERKNGYEMVEKIGLYWHFVDLVWVFVFLAFYLL